MGILPTFHHSSIFGAGTCPRFVPYFCIAWLHLISTCRYSWICSIVPWTCSSSMHHWSRFSVGLPGNVTWWSASWTAKNGVYVVDSDFQILATHSSQGSHCTQTSWWWFNESRRNWLILAFIGSVWPSLYCWNAVDIHRSIPNRIHICLHKDEVN
jgi:hypothetical protein